MVVCFFFFCYSSTVYTYNTWCFSTLILLPLQLRIHIFWTSKIDMSVNRNDSILLSVHMLVHKREFCLRVWYVYMFVYECALKCSAYYSFYIDIWGEARYMVRDIKRRKKKILYTHVHAYFEHIPNVCFRNSHCSVPFCKVVFSVTSSTRIDSLFLLLECTNVCKLFEWLN